MFESQKLRKHKTGSTFKDDKLVSLLTWKSKKKVERLKTMLDYNYSNQPTFVSWEAVKGMHDN